jgi:hypothetical protein
MRYEFIFHLDAADALRLLKWAKKHGMEPTTIWDHGPTEMGSMVTIERDEAVAVIENQNWQNDRA